MHETAGSWGDSSRLRVAGGYALMLGASAAGFLAVRSWGRALTAPAPVGAPFSAAAGRPDTHTLFHLLLALVVVIATARTLGAIFKYVRQPPVIGDVLAGILLGPSLLGSLAPQVTDFVLPAVILPYFGILAQVGVILYMFVVGLELDTSALRHGTHATVAISHASILAPFLLGTLLALAVYPRLSTSDVPFTSFALFMGVSMSVTAFPVLARILRDRDMHRSRLGVLALACAAVDDATAWCLLAFVVGVAQARPGAAAHTLAWSGVYVAVVLAVARPLLARLARHVDRAGQLGQPVTAVVVVALLLSALATEAIGIHAIFGAFLLGATIPHESLLARELTRRIEDLSVVLLLPAFFAFSGMRTRIGLVSGAEHWLLCAAIVAVACVGKFGGSALAARFTGLGWRDAAILGTLMNTRGLMELIVLNVGLDLGIISPTLFAMLVIMAIVTTVMTAPILHLLSPPAARPEARAPSGGARSAADAACS